MNAYTYDYDGYQTAFDTTGTDNDATYTYDADKRRIDKVVDSVTTKYFLNGSDVIADYDGSDALVATYVTPGPPRRVNLDNNVSQTRSGSTYYYMKDGLGSVRNLVDSSEAAQNTYDYYAFGKELGTWTQSVTNRYTYTAREYDAEAKQYYYRARYYAGTGRFDRRDDALHSIAGAYLYVNGNPMLRVDPTGNVWWNPFTWFRSDENVDKMSSNALKSLSKGMATKGLRTIATAIEKAKLLRQQGYLYAEVVVTNRTLYADMKSGTYMYTYQTDVDIRYRAASDAGGKVAQVLRIGTLAYEVKSCVDHIKEWKSNLKTMTEKLELMASKVDDSPNCNAACNEVVGSIASFFDALPRYSSIVKDSLIKYGNNKCTEICGQ